MSDTVRVRIAVAVYRTDDGKVGYNAVGWMLHGEQESDGEMRAIAVDPIPVGDGEERVVFVEADVPLPESQTMAGRVTA